MSFKDLEAKAKAAEQKMLTDLNATEATWLAWGKAHKFALVLGIVGVACAVASIWNLV